MLASRSALMVSRALAGSRASAFSMPFRVSVLCSSTSRTQALLVNGFAELLTGMSTQRVRLKNAAPNRIILAATV